MDESTERNDKLKLVGHVYEFGSFRVVPSERQLLRDGQRVMLPPKAFETLVILVQNSGHAVKKEDLIRTLWPEAFVEESNLNHYVSILRKALSDGPNGERYIETVPKYGYRFIAEVRESHDVATSLLTHKHTRTHVVVREETEERKTETRVQANPFQTRSLQRVAVLTLALLIIGSTAVYFGYLRPAHSRSAVAPSAVSLRTGKPENPAARDAYLKGRYFWSQRTDEGFRKAADYFMQAIEIDPAFAPGYAGLADCYLLYGVTLEQKSPYTFHEVLKKALELDDTLAEAHATLAYYKSAVEWDWAGAEKEFERAIALNPNYATAHHWHAYNLISTGNTAAAIAEITRAQEIDPTSLVINADVGHIYYLARRNDLAFLALRKTLQMDPNFGDAHLRLGDVYAQEGRYDEAIVEFEIAKKLKGGENLLASCYLGFVYALSGKRAEAQEFIGKIDRSTKGTPYPEVYDKALILAALGQKDEAFKLLNQAYERRQGALALLKVEPKLDGLRADPRFADLLQRMHLS